MRSGRSIPWIPINMGIAIGLLAAFAILGPGIGQGEEDGSTYILLAAALAFVFMGSSVTSRLPGHRVGWVLTANGMLLVGSGIAVAFADLGFAFGGAIGYWAWVSWFISIGFLILWFPSGRVPSPRWRWVQWLGGLLLGFVGITCLFAGRLCVEGSDNQCDVWVDNPIGIPGLPNPEYGPIATPILLFMIGFLVLAAASLVVRLVKARGVERQQLKWLAIGMVFFVAWMLIPEQVMALWRNNLLLGVAVVGLPVSIALAVLRYRLYDIDRIFSRTVSYVIVVVLLGATYALGLAGLTSLLDTESSLAVAATTLVVAALFNPLRKRVQGFVDRRFNRSRYDAQRVMDEFTGALRDRVDGADLADDWLGVVSKTMQPTMAGLWLRNAS
ncbi:MAG: hypothetical protein ACRDU7_01635 [Acidimicrobiia bacterium]